MQLATRFKHGSNSISQSSPISNEQLRRYIPSVFAESPHDSRSSRYTYVPTSEVLSGLRKEGFEPFFAIEAKARDESKHGYTKHMLRLRHASANEATRTASEVPEIILVNSHDGSTSYQMLAGMFRFVCCNGMVVGQNIEEVRVHHKGDIVGRVIEGAYEVLKDFDRVRESAHNMKQITLSDAEQTAFARAALVAKYGEQRSDETPKSFPITERQILQPRRYEDSGADLWRTFNRVQENLVQGGLRGRSTNGRRTRTRGVTGISENVALNRALWTLADAMAKIKG